LYGLKFGNTSNPEKPYKTGSGAALGERSQIPQPWNQQKIIDANRENLITVSTVKSPFLRYAMKRRDSGE
jgi:hypothetical protein